MKKLLLILLAMMLAVTPGLASGMYEQDGDFLYELREDGTAQIRRYLGQDSTVVIPSEVGGATVTEIRGLDPMYSVSKIVIPDTVIYTHMPIDESDTSMDESKIPDNPFASVRDLTEIVVGENNPVFEVIDGVLFTKENRTLVCYPRARAADTYAIPEGTVAIGRDALRGASFSEVVFPSTLVSVNMQAFCECENLIRAELPESVIEMSKSVFFECESLTEAVLPEAISEIPYSTFNGCSALRSVQFSGQLEAIGVKAFKNCKSLTNIVFPSTLVTIGESAFENCPIQP